MTCPVVHAIGQINGAFAESEGTFCIVGGAEYSISEASYLASKMAIKAASRELAGLPPKRPHLGESKDAVLDVVLYKLKYQGVIRRCVIGLQLAITRFESALLHRIERGGFQGVSIGSYKIVNPTLRPESLHKCAVAATAYLSYLRVDGKRPAVVAAPDPPEVPMLGGKITEDYVNDMIAVYKAVEAIEEYNSRCINCIVECTNSLTEFAKIICNPKV